MGSKWRESVLGELLQGGHATLQTGPFGTALKADEYTPTGVPLISVREIREGYFQIEEATPKVDQSVISRLPKFVLKKGDIVFARKGGIERNSLVTATEDGWFLGSDGIFLRFREGNDSRFFSYVMRSDLVRLWLLKNCEGTTMPSLNQKILARIPIYLPPLKEQTKIANWLSILDKKITLNRQINQTLEQMAQALFKSWFVDFDPVVDNALDAGFFEQNLGFPDELLRRAEARKAVREKGAFKPLPNVIRQLFPTDFEECADPSFGHGGWVPKGWRVLPFGEFIERKSVGKKYDQKSASTEGKVPILDQGKSGIIGFHDDEPSVSASFDRPVIVFANHTCYMRLINFDFSAIQNVLPFTGRHVDTTWAFFATQGRVKFSEYKGHWPDFIIEKAVVPSLLLTTKFRDEIDSLLRITRSYELQNETLIKLRDTLLPKLISGELRLDEIEADLSKEEKPNSVGQRRDGWAATSPSSELHGCKSLTTKI